MSTPTRRSLHFAGVRFAERALVARGCRVQRHPCNDAVTLTVWPTKSGKAAISVAVRAARPRDAQHAVTVGGKRYQYRYRVLHFNLHSHAQRKCFPDVWVLVVITRRPLVFVVPQSVLGKRMTVQLQAALLPGRGGARVRAFAGRWDVITGNADVARVA